MTGCAMKSGAKIGCWVAGRLRNCSGIERKSPAIIRPHTTRYPFSRPRMAPLKSGWREQRDPIGGNFTLSISHSHGVSFCAIAPRSYLLGADIEGVEPRSPGFVEDYFTADERDLVQKASAVSRDLLITTIWSGKEAALKAVRQGLRRDRRSVSCHIPLPVYTSGPQKARGNWMPFSVYWFGLQENNRQATFFGWWQVWGNFVLTVVVAAEANRCL